jgi:hypothetical protein
MIIAERPCRNVSFIPTRVEQPVNAPPEHICAGERRVAALADLPDLVPADRPVGLPPEHDFRRVAEQPAIADDAVIARLKAGHETRLNAAGHRRRHRFERGHGAAAGHRRQARRVNAQMPRRQPDDDHRQHRFQSFVPNATAGSRNPACQTGRRGGTLWLYMTRQPRASRR